MRKMSTNILILALLGTAGCASSPQLSRLPGVGPTPATASANGSVGYLQVYSARERLPLNVNGEAFYWNGDYGRNDFQFGTAHTGYSLYSRDGQLLVRVPNATGMNDADPTLVKLAPGDYRVKAEAADARGNVSKVMVPVCIEAGQTTLVHLDGQWIVRTTGADDQWVRLAGGSVVGWHCDESEGTTLALQASR
jgi:hypothetical protein